MQSRLKKAMTWGIVGAVFYFFLSHHIIFIGPKIKLLKKTSNTLEYTMFSIQGKSNASILAIEPLRECGIGELLVDMGRMSEQELDQLMEKYRYSY